MIGEHVLAAYAPGGGGRDALAFAEAVVAHTTGRLTVAHVHPPDRPAAAGEAATLLRQAEAALGDRPAAYTARESRSVARGLAGEAGKAGADLIVVGSTEGGAGGRIAIGSTADHLLHSAPEAVALVPAGWPPAVLGRITVMYVDRPQCDEAVTRAALAALTLGVPLRLVTLALPGDPAERFRDDLAMAIRLAVDSTGIDPGEVSAELAEGDDVADALAGAGWDDGDLLVCASSEDAAAHRVFVGEVALKMLRAATVPAIVLPRGYS
ncbi:universal stress protein [Actinomadura flavalba]|uniref:universal stress protein n=1 Tax=Actinomadura flavalba TaxID=1120938 RepID=UPI000362DC4F|nr:universal stress protein [Actinomadura flavalba]